MLLGQQLDEFLGERVVSSSLPFMHCPYPYCCKSTKFSSCSECICRAKKYCVSALYNCALACSNPSDTRVAAACHVKADLSAITRVQSVCSDADVLAGRWVKLYWDTDEDCGEGYDPIWWPGILKEKTCCTASQICNAPAASPPSLRCFSAKFSPSAGYCAGKISSVSACAVSQARAEEKAASIAKVKINNALTSSSM